MDHYEEVPSVTSLDHVTAAVKQIQARGPWVHYLEAAVEAQVLVCSKVREVCNIPCLPYAVTELCRDKFVMKNFLRKKGFPVARDAAVSNAKEARTGAKHVGYPHILKPRAGAGAMGTYRIDSPAQLEQIIQETRLEKGGQNCTMEQFLTGHEGFYDTITVNGKVVFEQIYTIIPMYSPPCAREASILKSPSPIGNGFVQ